MKKQIILMLICFNYMLSGMEIVSQKAKGEVIVIDKLPYIIEKSGRYALSPSLIIQKSPFDGMKPLISVKSRMAFWVSLNLKQQALNLDNARGIVAQGSLPLAESATNSCKLEIYNGTIENSYIAIDAAFHNLYIHDVVFKNCKKWPLVVGKHFRYKNVIVSKNGIEKEFNERDEDTW